jgi:hypothetical protein
VLTLDHLPTMVGVEMGFGTAGGGEVAEQPPLLPATARAALACPVRALELSGDSCGRVESRGGVGRWSFGRGWTHGALAAGL